MFPSEGTGSGGGGGGVAEMAAVDGNGTAAMSASSVGRLVDCSQADDRRVIRLVRERRLLYARNQLPVANYYTRVKALWEEVADEMGWSVAEVRRKWSHIRNSYSRHLRNEVGCALTGRGRHVSRWYLADELDFLREHMATDTRRAGSASSSPSLVYVAGAGAGTGTGTGAGTGAGGDVTTVGWGGESPPGRPWSELVISPLVKMEAPDSPTPTWVDDSSSNAFGSHETDSYFNFFRGIHDDYLALTERKQRLFRRQCLELLHRLLDQQDDLPVNAVLPH